MDPPERLRAAANPRSSLDAVLKTLAVHELAHQISVIYRSINGFDARMALRAGGGASQMTCLLQADLQGTETFSVDPSNAADPDGSSAAHSIDDPASATVAIRENDALPRRCFACARNDVPAAPRSGGCGTRAAGTCFPAWPTSPAGLTVAENGSETISPGASEPNGDSLAFSVVVSPSKGSDELNGTAVTYTPDDGVDRGDVGGDRQPRGNGQRRGWRNRIE